MRDGEFIKLGYDDIFYNTIGKIDSIIIKMVMELLNIDFNYNNVHIYRNGGKYISCSLVLVFDSYLYVDVRLGFDNKFGMRKKDIIEGFYSFIDIYDNTYGLDENEYQYVMLCLNNNGGNLLCDVIKLGSNFNDNYLISNCFKVVYYDCSAVNEILNDNVNIRNIDCKIRWLSLLNVSRFRELDYIIGEDLFSIEEKEALYKRILEISNIQM